MAKFMKAGSVIVHLIMKSWLWRHLNKVFTWIVKRLITANAKISARVFYESFSVRNLLTLGPFWGAFVKLIGQAVALFYVKYAIPF